MPQWYAVICLTDQFTPDGKLDYPAGAVKSFGTVLSGTDTELAAKGVEAVPIGIYADGTGPDFRTERFDVVQKKMVPYTPPKDEVDLLLDKPSWTPTDSEAAMRAILKGMKGK